MSEKEIKDFTFYTTEMEKGMKDKLYFLDFLDSNRSYNFLDYGCANGKTLEAICNTRRKRFDSFCGYDKSSEMIELAKSQWQGISNNVKFIADWKKRYIDSDKQTILILSSVLHEIYSFYNQTHCPKAWIDAVWNEDIFAANADYIVIRDMCWSESMNRKLDDEALSHFIPNFLKNSGVKKQQVDEFEDVWGSISNVKNFIHLLLKYRYVVNWEHELHENYLSVKDTELFNRALNSNYDIVYVSRFQLPIIEKFTKLGFGNNIEDNTHIKLILKRK